MNMNPTTHAEAVANGAQMLDEKVPGWHRIIDLDTLSINCCQACVCGQLGRNLGWKLFHGMEDYPSCFGFEVLEEEMLGTRSLFVLYMELDVEWQLAIRARLDADKLPAPQTEREAIVA